VTLASKRVAIVFGTFNRLEMLKSAVTSVRAAVGILSYTMFIIDGGSTDGTKEWLRHQTDVKLIEQEGALTGAVRAFNLGFGAAVDDNYDFVVHLNDDAEIVTADAIEKACRILLANDKIGEVAFEFDLRGSWGFDHVNGALYANYGVIRREAGMAVARAQGDASGRAWWNPIYRTYGADTEFGVWLWKLGWRVHYGEGLRVHDLNAKDALRESNEGKNADAPLFWSRWKNEKIEINAKLESDAAYGVWLAHFVRDHRVKKIVSLGCDDLEELRRIDIGSARFCVADASQERVDNCVAKYPHWRFKRRDIRTWVPNADLVLCKDVLQQWSTAEVSYWLNRLDDRKDRFRYALITNYNYGATVNVAAPIGSVRAIDLTAAPFSRGKVVFQWGAPNRDVVLVRGRRPRS